MTVHLALLGRDASILVSDSQGSTDEEQQHGYPKQVAGDGFLLGGAGRGDVLVAALDEAATGAFTNQGKPLDAGNVAGCLEMFLNDHVREAASSGTTFLLVIDANTSRSNQLFMPSTFKHFRRSPGALASIGSGASFVSRRWRALNKMGIALPTDSLGDVVYSALILAEASGDSLTVDDTYSVGIRYGDRTYVLAHKEIRTPWLPAQLRGQKERDALQATLSELINAAKTIQGEIASAIGQVYRAVSAATVSPQVTLGCCTAIGTAIGEAAKQRLAFDAKIKDFRDGQDALLGRAPIP